MSTLTPWAQAHPFAAAAAGILLLAVAALALRPLRRTPAAVGVASLAAMACTVYSADTSWRFAEHRLDMASVAERGAMFAAAELALFSCALMARQNLRSPQGTPGTPGVLVWVITGVQVIPAYSESGVVGGTVRAVVGPVMAALLWHLAMGIELRHTKPGTDSQSLPALLAREARERLLSRLGLAVRDRTAEQITRDRWTVKAVALAAKLASMPDKARGRARVERRLSVAVGKAQAGADGEQRTKLLDLLAARRHAAALATIDLPSPWETVPEVTIEVPDFLDVVQEVPDAMQPAEVVMPPMPALDFRPLVWPPDVTATDRDRMTAAVPAETGRQVVTEAVTVTPSELRRKARSLHREAVRSTRRPVTIKTLQNELGLSRREATELRREVVGGDRS
ncbi:hypothetical protein [Streptomyces sp. MK5]|uniref:hypothetical protein n=1 Tax=Streptomyces sp. MK5 TaxID=3064253 RepID=UPI002740D9C2|nr:hypothetical protein [Streptomyces sp. MK5]